MQHKIPPFSLVHTVPRMNLPFPLRGHPYHSIITGTNPSLALEF